MREAWTKLGSPGAKIPTVLIGGTNGKGSTVEFLASMVEAGGIKAGVFTSPHLKYFRERIRTSHMEVSDAMLSQVWEKVRSGLGEEVYEELSFFEIATLMALVTFEDLGCELNILEVGLGGKWDATNVVEPSISVITSIGYDHQIYLGSTLLEISREKLGIARPDRPLLVGHSADFETEAQHQQFEQDVRATGARAHFYDKDFECTAHHVALPNGATVDLPEFVRDQPFFLRHNFALACAVYEILRTSKKQLAPLDVVLKTDNVLRKPAGRYQKLEVEGRRVIADVCHNTSGARALIKALREEEISLPVPAFVSILKDKDWQQMLTIFKGFFSPLVLFRVDSERTWTAQDVPRLEECIGFFDSFEEAWNGLHSSGEKRREPYVICGSIAAMGEVFEFLKSKSCGEGWGSAHRTDSSLENQRPGDT
jgi:dihydrofolate synthase / folylpolyglutamate synthase